MASLGRVTHADHDRARHPRPFFLNDKEAEPYDDGDGTACGCPRACTYPAAS